MPGHTIFRIKTGVKRNPGTNQASKTEIDEAGMDLRPIDVKNDQKDNKEDNFLLVGTIASLTN
jgi:hypothetical protein